MTGRREASNGHGRYARERERMVEEQVLGRGIADARVVDAMRRVPRHLFVEEALRDQAYGDSALPIGEGQTISQPYTVARMTELLRLTGRERVLEVGTGSGYQAALLGQLAGRVCTIERVARLAERARQTLESLGYTNVWVRTSNGTLGWPDQSPFDRIIVTAGGPEVPPPLVEQLADGGRLIMPVGDAAGQKLRVMDKQQGRMRVTEHSGYVFVKLIGKYAWSS